MRLIRHTVAGDQRLLEKIGPSTYWSESWSLCGEIQAPTERMGLKNQMIVDSVYDCIIIYSI